MLNVCTVGGESIYDGEPFEDESFQVKFNRRYMLAMANSGKKNSNRSQFFVNTVKTQWLDGKSEIFGMVLEGKKKGFFFAFFFLNVDASIYLSLVAHSHY